MPASIRLSAAGVAIAGCLLGTGAPGASAAQAATTPLITVAMTSSGNPSPRYEIRVRNGTNGMVKTTVRQALPPGATPSMISQGGTAAGGGQPGLAGTEVVWQVQLGAQSTALLTTTLVPPAARTNVTAPACAFVANGNMPYDCATATWDPTKAAAVGGGGSGIDNSVRAEPAPPWWRRTTLLGTAIAVLILLAAAGGALWWRRLRRRTAAGGVNTTAPPDAATGRREAADQPAENRAAEQQRAAERRAAEQRAAEQRAAEQRAAEQRAAEQRAAEQRAAERHATEQHAAEQRAADRGRAERRVIRRSGNPIARARARVRGDAKIAAPESVRRATGHPRIDALAEPESGGVAEPDEMLGNAVPGVPENLPRHGSPLEHAAPVDTGEPVEEHGLLRDGGLLPNDEPVAEDGLVGIAGGARYVGQAAIPPRTAVPDEPPVEEEPEAEPPEPQPEEVSPAIGRARPRPHPATAYRPRRRVRPPGWLAVGLALLLAVAFATGTAWVGSSQVSAISSNRQPSSGAWVGRTVAGPVGTSLRESAFEFTVYRLSCPPAPAGCQAIVGVRNVTDRSQQWHGTLQRAYLPTGDWVGADVPATQTANAGRDPFADPVPAGERMVMPLVFTPAGPSAPTRIELRSEVFSAGVSVDVPR